MANRYKIPERCDHWAQDGQCAALETRRFLNGWFCTSHTPYALTGTKEPESTAHLYKPIVSGVRTLDWNESYRQTRTARIGRKRTG